MAPEKKLKARASTDRLTSGVCDSNYKSRIDEFTASSYFCPLSRVERLIGGDERPKGIYFLAKEKKASAQRSRYYREEIA